MRVKESGLERERERGERERERECESEREWIRKEGWRGRMEREEVKPRDCIE